MRKLIAALGIFLACVTGASASGQVQSNFGANVSSFTLCSGPCAAIEFGVVSTAAIFVYVFDSATLPGNGTVGTNVKGAWPVASGQTFTYQWGATAPAIFLNGMTIGCSSAVPPTFTAVADCEMFGRAN